MVLDRETLVGRVGLDRQATQITDVLADPDYGLTDAQRVAGYRTIMGVPMLLDGEVVGVLSVWRTQVDPFSDRAVEVLTTFAAQAALAVRTVDLVRTLESRTDELGRKLNQLEALGAVGQAVSSSLNLTEVLNTIITQAVQLSGTDGGSIYEFDEDAKEFRVETVCGTSPEALDALRRTRIGLDDTFLGKAATLGRPLELPDLRDAPLDPHLSVLAEGGWRSLVAVPMLRERPHRRCNGCSPPYTRARPARDLRPAGDVRQPVRTGLDQRAAVPATRAAERRTRSREPAQVGIPGQYVARAAYTAERHHRLF